VIVNKEADSTLSHSPLD